MYWNSKTGLSGTLLYHSLLKYQGVTHKLSLTFFSKMKISIKTTRFAVLLMLCYGHIIAVYFWSFLTLYYLLAVKTLGAFRKCFSYDILNINNFNANITRDISRCVDVTMGQKLYPLSTTSNLLTKADLKNKNWSKYSRYCNSRLHTPSILVTCNIFLLIN